MTNGDKPASKQIDDIVQSHEAWKAQVLKRLRSVILSVDSHIIEEVKWKTPSRPLGLPAWSYGGIVCFAEIWKDNVKLLFPKGARLESQRHFNARLKSADIRAIEFRQGDEVNEYALTALIKEAIVVNTK